MTPRHFGWQAWHLATSTFVLRGKRGALSHPPSFCVAGVALGDRHLRSAWQASPGAASLSHKFVRHSWSSSSSRRPPVTHNTTLSHTIFHTQLSHTTLSTTIFHTPNSHTQLSHATLSHTIFHTLSFTYHFVTHHLSTLLDAPRPPLPPAARLSHTTQLCHTPSFTHNFHT